LTCPLSLLEDVPSDDEEEGLIISEAVPYHKNTFDNFDDIQSPPSLKKRETRKLSSIIMPHMPMAARAQFESLYSTTQEDFQVCYWYYCW
jgi:hypothetical protein